MTEHRATIRFRHDGADFGRGKYSRAHTWSFDGGLTVPASSSPSVIRPPYSDPAAVDPEEAFVAAIASCHMMSFLYAASHAGHVVLSYEDDAVGSLQKNAQGVAWISTTLLSPRIVYQGEPPSADEEDALHARAHATCFIAQSIKTEVRVAPTNIRRRPS